MAKVVDDAKSGLVGAIKVVLLFGALIAVIAFARQQPETFQTVINALMETAARLIIWLCNVIQNALPASSASG